MAVDGQREENSDELLMVSGTISLFAFMAILFIGKEIF
jgi:hypothetical protein